ncbi:DUF3800 domain-containing protein [Lapidilactobacillus luobeiensis]|uniref:DUF3800 domain-containing protein n=1 Tax=Lapidilactobacillus luobeiensis TaxID=2950371 RepID=UPI0021C48ACB|nr:DUF3800 domain-containing protein [Lapidilactobacillus luobeiensis]
MEYFLCLDDSGAFNQMCTQGKYFVYGGLLMPMQNFHSINQAYGKYVDITKQRFQINGELKGKALSLKIRKKLLKVLDGYDCDEIFVTTQLPSLARLDFTNSRDILRYKNYMIMRLIEALIKHKRIPSDCDKLTIYIDNQNIANSAQDSLETYLNLRFNEDNYYYIHRISYTTFFQCEFLVKYRDSKYDAMIQAADILANTAHNSFNWTRDGKPLRYFRTFLKNDYFSLHLPDDVHY